MTKRPRALLIVPPTGRYIRESRCQTPIDELKTIALRAPIDLLYAAAAFEQKGCECQVIDCPAEDLGWDDLRRRIHEFQPRFLVMEITTPTLEEDLKAADMAREIDPTIVTIAQGAHFNIFDVQALESHSNLDIVFRGEFEATCAQLACDTPLEDIPGITWRDDEGRIQRNPGRAFEQNLDVFPFPSRHLIRNDLYIRPDTGARQTTIVTNRGCPHRCIFCLANQVAGGVNRYRSEENVLDEIRECVEVHGIRSFLFRSDLFTQNREWVIDLCRRICESDLKIDWAANSRVDRLDEELLRWMKKAGCWIIAFGVESGIDEHLALMNKKADTAQALRAIAQTRKAGILTSVYMLMGMPWESADTVRSNIRFFKKLDADFTEIFYVYPFPGTALYDLAVDKGLLEKGAIPRAAYSAPAMATEFLSIEELGRLRKFALRRLYLRPRYVLRTLLRATRQGSLGNYLRYGLMTLKDLFFPHSPK